MSGSAGGRAEQDLPRQAPHRAADPTSWLTAHRRLARDYEAGPAHAETMIRWAMIGIMVRRLPRQGPTARPRPQPLTETTAG